MLHFYVLLNVNHASFHVVLCLFFFKG